MANYNHGVYTSEQPTSAAVPVSGSAGIQVIVGTAPHVLDGPVLCNTYEEAKEALGTSDDWDTYTLCAAAYVAFEVFGVAPVVFINAGTEENDADVAASDIVTALDKVREVHPRFGVVPGAILAPGWSHENTVAAKMKTAAENINGVYNCIYIADVDTAKAKLYSEVKSQKDSQALSAANCVAVWPSVNIGEHIVPGSAIIGSLYAYNDANNDDVPSLRVSNVSVPGISGVCLSDGTEVLLDQSQANSVNGDGVVTFLNLGGFRVWGNNTAVYPTSTDPKDRWIGIRRFFLWRRNSVIESYFQQVDSPANYRLIQSICDAENVVGNSFVSDGVCAAYSVEFRSDENSVTDLMSGALSFHITLAPYTPAEQIDFKFEFDPNAIETALNGGE